MMIEKAYHINNEGDLLRTLNDIFDQGLRKNFNRADLCKLVTVTSELGTNLCKYAIHGKLKFTLENKSGQFLAEIVSTDEGPGIPDVEVALKEKYSTGNSLGLGLSSVKRLSDRFEIKSQPSGTIVKIQKWIKQ